jgi:TolB protein
MKKHIAPSSLLCLALSVAMVGPGAGLAQQVPAVDGAGSATPAPAANPSSPSSPSAPVGEAGNPVDAASPGTPAGANLVDRDIYIDVGRAGARKLRIAVPAFAVNAAGGLAASDAQTWSDRLADILGFTGGFEFIPASGFLAKDPAARAVNFDEWTGINTEALVLAKAEPGSKPGRVNLQLRLYDVKKKKQLVGKAYNDTEKSKVDAVLRRFADLCMEAFTGELGIFSTKIAFVGAKAPGETKQLYVVNFDGTGLEQITKNGSINMSPSWSPDGTKITFTSFKDGKAEIYAYSTVTRKIGRLTRSPGNNSGAAWHPDGKMVAFSGSASGKTAIFTMNGLDGANRKEFISGSGLEVEPSFSPDGAQIAFASGRFGNPHIFVRDLGSGKDTRITFAGWYNSSPSWRPDGKKLAFAGYDREIDRYDVFIVNPDGRQMERLTLDQGDNEKPSFSPDGRFIAFQSNRASAGRGKQKGYRIFVMNRDGGEQRALTIPLHEVTMPSWSPRLSDFD